MFFFSSSSSSLPSSFEVAALGNFALWARAGEASQVGLALSADVEGSNRASCVSAALTTHAAAEGIAKGQIAAGINNMANIGKIFGPLTYTFLFAKYGQAAPFASAASVILLCQILLRTLKKEDICVGKKPSAGGAKGAAGDETGKGMTAAAGGD